MSLAVTRVDGSIPMPMELYMEERAMLLEVLQRVGEEISSLKQRADEQDAQLDTLRVQGEMFKNQGDVFRTQADTLRQEAEAQKAQIKALQEQGNTLRAQEEATRAREDALRDEVATLTGQTHQQRVERFHTLVEEFRNYMNQLESEKKMRNTTARATVVTATALGAAFFGPSTLILYPMAKTVTRAVTEWSHIGRPFCRTISQKITELSALSEELGMPLPPEFTEIKELTGESLLLFGLEMFL